MVISETHSFLLASLFFPYDRHASLPCQFHQTLAMHRETQCQCLVHCRAATLDLCASAAVEHGHLCYLFHVENGAYQ